MSLGQVDESLSLMANFPTGRRASSRQDFPDDERDRDMDYTGPRGAGRRPRDDHDYTGMYDDEDRGRSDHPRGHYEEERYQHDHRGYRDRDDPGFRSPPRRRYHSRSGSQSPIREAGRPSDTVILEGLPFTVSAREVCNPGTDLNDHSVWPQGDRGWCFASMHRIHSLRGSALQFTARTT